MRDLTQGNIHKTFLVFSLPIILSSMLQTAFGLINTSVAGLFLGPQALAALGATSSYFGIIQALFYGHAYGLSIYAGNMFGAKEYRHLKTSVQTNILLVLGVSTLFAAISILCYRPVFHYLNIEDAIWEETKTYYFCLCVHLVVSLCSHFYLMCCNAVGVTTFPLVISIVASVLNVVGNLLSVTVLNLGVLGIGLATVLSAAVSFLCYFIRFRHYYRQMGVHKIKVTPHWRYIARVFPASGPNILQQISMHVANLVTAPLTNGMGYVALAVLAIGGNIRNWLVVFYNASAKTASNYIAQCVGAKKFNLIKKAARTALLHSFVVVLPLMALIYIFPDALCDIFIQDGSDSAVREGVGQYIRVFFPMCGINMVCAVFHSVFRGVGANDKLLIGSIITSVASIVLGFLLIPSMGLMGYYLCHGIAWAIEAAYEVIVYWTGRWIPKHLRKEIWKQKNEKQEITE
ncbi:MAG: MATE family efflux transporter [Clostridia bacterium]|nr:MATE family efflux transporter [Clostridia bacterium]